MMHLRANDLSNMMSFTFPSLSSPWTEFASLLFVVTDVGVFVTEDWQKSSVCCPPTPGSTLLST